MRQLAKIELRPQVYGTDDVRLAFGGKAIKTLDETGPDCFRKHHVVIKAGDVLASQKAIVRGELRVFVKVVYHN
jgi:hypothetical protein